MAAQPADIEVEVVYALSRREQSIRLIVPEGATVREVLEQSGLLPQVRGKVGIFGKVVSPDRALANGDRIEIYRPLPEDPKEARRRRAARRR